MRVHIPTPLRSYTGGAAEVEGEGADLLSVLDALDAAFPGIKFRIVDEQGQIRAHIKLFVSGRPVDNLSATVEEREQVHILCALSGGQ